MNQITTAMAVQTRTARRVRLLQHSSTLLLLYRRIQQLKIIGFTRSNKFDSNSVIANDSDS